MEIHTIGFTKKSAEEFFERLRQAGIQRLIDVRLRNTSHLSGFAKRDDLEYFLNRILDVDYVHEPLLAPTDDLLDAYRNEDITWKEYEDDFRALMHERAIDRHLDRALFKKPVVLLCSEAKPDRCHRRLVAEELADSWGDVDIVNL